MSMSRVGRVLSVARVTRGASLFLGLVAIAACGLAIRVQAANDADAVKPEDHPFAVVAFASFDRLKARAASLGEAIGAPEFADKWIANGFDGDESLGKIFNSPGFDPTRPLGVMSFPKWFRGGHEATGDLEVAGESVEEKSDESNSIALPSLDDLFETSFGFLAEGALEDSTLAICIPAKDREQMLAAISEIAGEQFSPIEGRAGWFAAEKNKDMRVLFAGRYVLLLADHGKVKQWDRKYPDFEKLAKASLGQNGFVYSLHRRGLPKVMREDMAEAFKLAHAATLQRQDNEPEAAFKLRTMFGPLLTESLDLLLSQIDEFRITGHVDSNTHQILVDAELVGPKDGKLAKLANGLTTKSSLFGNLMTDDALFAANVSLPLSPKLWKPVVESLRVIGEVDQPLTGLSEIARTLAKTIEVGQLELHASYTRGEEGLLALRVAGNPAFPEQVQAALEVWAKLPADADHAGAVKIAVDTVEGWPIHQLPTSVLAYLGLIGIDPSDLIPTRVPTTTIHRVEVDGDGNNSGVTQVQRIPVSAEPSSFWLVATPNGIWLALGSPGNHDCPAWFKPAIEASLAKPKSTTTANRSNAPVRVVLRGLGASPSATDSANEKPRDAKVTQAAAKGVDVDLGGAEKLDIVGGGVKPRKMTAEELAAHKAQLERAEQQVRERGDLLRDGSNAIRVELRPTANGLRVRTTFDDAYFHWFATMMKHSLDAEGEWGTLPNAEVEPADVKPPPPK